MERCAAVCNFGDARICSWSEAMHSYYEDGIDVFGEIEVRSSVIFWVDGPTFQCQAWTTNDRLPDRLVTALVASNQVVRQGITYTQAFVSATSCEQELPMLCCR